MFGIIKSGLLLMGAWAKETRYHPKGLPPISRRNETTHTYILKVNYTYLHRLTSTMPCPAPLPTTISKASTQT